MSAGTTYRWFREDRCDRCGICFRDCPVLDLSGPRAIRDIEALIAGDVDQSQAFRYCTTCNLCDALCPQDADPYELLLQRFHEAGRAQGLPSIARLVIPTERGNLWTGVRTLMDPGELALLDRWQLALGERHEEILLTGFYTNLVPYLAQATVLDPLRPHIAGGEGLWGCGGDTHKMGLLDHTEQVVPLVGRVLRETGVRRVWCFMSAEAAMLTEVLPRRYGAQFDVEVGTLDEWLLGRLVSGDVEVTRPLGRRVTVQDNCMSRYFGSRHHDVVRDLVTRCGGEPVEMAHCRDCTLCCGWAATIPTLFGPGSDHPRRSLTYMLSSLKRRVAEALDSGAEVMVASCPACYLFLNMAVALNGDPIEVVHPVELVEAAAGGAPATMARRRALDVLAVASHLLVGGDAEAARGRFTPPPIDPDQLIEPLEADEREIRSIRRWASVLRAALLDDGWLRTLTTRGVRHNTDLFAILAAFRKRRREDGT